MDKNSQSNTQDQEKDLSGIINLLKPPGMTSHDAVAAVRRILKIKKAGHTGTLDPGAAGVLPVLTGKATRISRYITEKNKSYRAELILGWQSDSGDAFGTVKESTDASQISRQDVEGALQKFNGEILQLPPMTSAIKFQGKKLYELARQGIEIERPRRKVFIYEIKLLDIMGEGTAHPRVMFDVICSKGTYIRTLCEDIGNMLKVGAYMSFLLRTATGEFHLADTVTLEEIACWLQEGNTEKFLLPLNQALAEYRQIIVDGQAEKAARSGNMLFSDKIMPAESNEVYDQGEIIRIVAKNGELLALAQIKEQEEKGSSRQFIQPIVVFGGNNI